MLPYKGYNGKPAFLTPPESQRQGAAGDDIAAEAAASASVQCRVTGCTSKSMQVSETSLQMLLVHVNLGIVHGLTHTLGLYI